MRIGRPKAAVDAAEIQRLRAQGLSWRAIARQLGLGLGTVYRAAGGCSKIVPDRLTEIGRGDGSDQHRQCVDHARFLAG